MHSGESVRRPASQRACGVQKSPAARARPAEPPCARPGEGRSARQSVLDPAMGRSTRRDVLGPARRARPGEGPPRASLLAHPAPLGELVLDPAQRALETRGVVLLLGALRVVDDAPLSPCAHRVLALRYPSSEPSLVPSSE